MTPCDEGRSVVLAKLRPMAFSVCNHPLLWVSAGQNAFRWASFVLPIGRSVG